MASSGGFGFMVACVDTKTYESGMQLEDELALAMLGCVMVMLVFWIEVLEDEVQGIGMAKAWCFLAQGNLPLFPCSLDDVQVGMGVRKKRSMMEAWAWCVYSSVFLEKQRISCLPFFLFFPIRCLPFIVLGVPGSAED
ncbi:unnamed protein product [Prunus armeniaca]|uniref:Uncharacterized protein n=1 Tax=Prunus armeniaca TaxID=36596 RepID=A0A6J5WPG7_PRUAR|nr:unnamed protein product [Prunus armeniaca]